MTPIAALSPRFITRTVLAVPSRSARPGHPVTLIATVKLTGGLRDVPAGSVTFLDGTADLGTVPLRRGKASLKTSSLQLGANTIQAEFTPGPGFAPSRAAIIEMVRVHRSRGKPASRPASATGRAIASTPIAIRSGGLAAVPPGTVTIIDVPTVLGPLGTDQARAARSGYQTGR